MTSGRRPDVAASTRHRILRDISTLGPITVSALVARLGITETAVRRHLDKLLAEGLIEARDVHERRGRGRPARSWVVSAAGHAELRADYDDLAEDAIRFLAERAGREAVRAFAEQRAADLVSRVSADLPPDASVTERTDGLVRTLRREGYAATVRPVAGPDAPAALAGVQLCQGHCPVQHVAAEFPEFCDAETEAISDLLGVHVQRLATLAQGDHVCTTFVPGASAPDATIPEERSEA